MKTPNRNLKTWSQERNTNHARFTIHLILKVWNITIRRLCYIYFLDDKKKRKRIRSVDARKSLPEPKRRKPLTPAAQLQMHMMEFDEFLKNFDLPKQILCPFCNREYGKIFYNMYYLNYNK